MPDFTAVGLEALDASIKLLDIRLAPLEQTIKDLRQDFKDQANHSASILREMTNKLEQRLDAEERRVADIAEIQNRHSSFISTVKWVTAAVVAILTAALGNALTPLFHIFPTVTATAAAIGTGVTGHH